MLGLNGKIRPKVLMVDDDNDIREAVCQAIELNEMTATCVSRGLTALQQYLAALNSGEPFNILLLDVALPDIPGFAIGKMIRDLEVFSTHVPRSRHVYYSAHPYLVNEDRLKQAAADGYLEKPGDMVSLLKLLRPDI